MKTPSVRLLAITIGLAFWGLNVTFAEFLGRTVNSLPTFFIYPCLVAASVFFLEYIRVRRQGGDPVVSWPNWASFAFILLPVIVGSGGLIWTFFRDDGSTNIMLYSLAAITGVQAAHLVNEV